MPIGWLLGIGKCHTSRVNTLNLLRVAKALKTVQCALLRAKSTQNIGQYKEEPNWPDPGHQKKKKKLTVVVSNTQLGLNDSLLS